jgi:hypothetical protein
MRYTAELLLVLHSGVTAAHHIGNSTMVSTRSHWFSWIRYTSLCARSGSPNPSAPCENSADCCGHCGQLASTSNIFRKTAHETDQMRSCAQSSSVRAGETCVTGALAMPFRAEQAALLHSQMGTLETGWVRKASLLLPRLSSLPSPRMEPGRASQRGRR